MQEVITIKDKTDQSDYIFIKNFYSLDTIYKWKRDVKKMVNTTCNWKYWQRTCIYNKWVTSTDQDQKDQRKWPEMWIGFSKKGSSGKKK